MWDMILHPSNTVFGISLCLMLMLGILELVLLIAGGGSHGLLDQFLPDDLSNHQSVEAGAESSTGLFTQLLEWLYVGRIPLLIWLIIFLTVFGLSGFILQSIFQQFTGHFLTAWIMAPACLILSMPLIRYSAMSIAKILPKDETTAIYSEELIGRTAVIVLGEAKQDSPAQAKVQDQFGQTHYVLVEPEQNETFTQGQSVILSQKTGAGFQAVSIPH